MKCRVLHDQTAKTWSGRENSAKLLNRNRFALHFLSMAGRKQHSQANFAIFTLFEAALCPRIVQKVYFYT